MPRLISGSALRAGGSNTFLDLAHAMPQLPATDTTLTGFTLVTDQTLVTTYRSSLGYLQFSTGTITNQIPDQNIVLSATGSARVVISRDTLSTNTDSGALVVEGGIGVGGNMFIAQDIVVNNLTIGQGYEGYNNIVMTSPSTSNPTGDFYDGQENINIGWGSMGGISSANRSIAIGRYALSSGTYYKGNIAIGDRALSQIGTHPSLLYDPITAISNSLPAEVTVPGNKLAFGAQTILLTVGGMPELTDQTVYVFPFMAFTATIGSSSTISGGIVNIDIENTDPANADILAYYQQYWNSYLQFEIKNDDGTYSTVYDESTTSTQILLMGTSTSIVNIAGFGPGSQVHLRIFGDDVTSDVFEIYQDNILNIPVDTTSLGTYTGGGEIYRVVGSDFNVAIGNNAGAVLYDGTKNFFMGDNIAPYLTTGSFNFLLGHDTGANMTRGSNNIGIMANNLVDSRNNQVGIGGIFYYDGLGHLNLNADTQVGNGTTSTGIGTGGLYVYGGASIADNLTIGGNITPVLGTSDLGSLSYPFNNLYLTGQTLYLGTVTFESPDPLTLNIGNTGTTSTAGVTVYAGGINLSGSVDSTSTVSGSLIVGGGAGIGGSVNIGGSLDVQGGLTSTATNTGSSITLYSGSTGSVDNIIIGFNAPQDGYFKNLHVESLSGNGSSNTATNLSGGYRGSIPYQYQTGVTTMLPIGNVGYVLTSNGSVPTWVAAGTITSNTSTNASNIYVNNASTSSLYYLTLSSMLDSYSPLASTATVTYSSTSGVLTIPGVSVTRNTASTSTTTGAVTVAGGVGVRGSVYSADGNSNENYRLYSPSVTVSITAPTNPRVGDFWLNAATGVECQYVQDGANRFWIEFAGI